MRRDNVKKVLSIMSWPTPRRIEGGVNGYVIKFHKENDPIRKKNSESWTYYRDQKISSITAKELSEEIFKKTEIRCKVTSGGNIQIPYAI